MTTKAPRSSLEREETDKSLRLERQKTDHEFSRREQAIEKGSDSVVRQARRQADDGLEEERDQADETLQHDGAPDDRGQAAVQQEREREDAALRQERVTTDEELMGERQERKRVLGNLLRFEREHTDERLLHERTHADDLLQEMDDVTRTVFMQVPAPVAITRGPEHILEFANTAYRRLVGKRHLLGKTVRAAFPELEGHQFFGLMDETYESGKPFHGAEMAVRLDGGAGAAPGEERFFNFIHQPLRGIDGRVDGIVTFGFEVTDQVHARLKTEASERRAQLMGEASRLLGTSLDLAVLLNGIARLFLPWLADFCVVDLLEDDRVITRVATAHVDPAKEELMRELQRRYPPDWGSPQPAARVLRTGMPEFLAETSRAVIAAHTQDEEHAALMRQIGVLSHIAVPMLARGRTVGALSFGVTEPGRKYTPDDVLVAQAIAERAAYAVDNSRLYGEAQHAIRVRDDFLSIAGHELKTPLTPIQLHLQGLIREVREGKADKLTPSRVGRKLETIARQVRRLESLVQRLLDVSRLADRMLGLQVERVDLSELIREVAGRFRAETEQTMTDLRVDVPLTLVVELDRLRLDQIISNLIGNAIKFGASRPIVVSATSGGDSARIDVKDHGIGIPPEDQRRIFQKFERAVPVRHFGGFGLGLWITRQTVEALGGTISVESEPGQGATFTVELPLRHSQPEEGDPSPHEE